MSIFFKNLNIRKNMAEVNLYLNDETGSYNFIVRKKYYKNVK